MTNNDHLTPVEPPALDKEASSGTRHLTGIYLKITTTLAIFISLYAIYSNALSNTKSFIVILFFLVVF
ncbi:TRAP-type C4-dicarboxylate transport system permease component [Proteus mirabilis]|uniref:TRAP-type C4-dicarboxylate transport system permease component n=1 Tax=Proteus mirabilis TaxID=584 RepID=A0A379GIU9_PROMI|nr:TRAP-type C4-dicarboxylate transport system permease component [Proteus mirabilis]